MHSLLRSFLSVVFAKHRTGSYHFWPIQNYTSCGTVKRIIRFSLSDMSGYFSMSSLAWVTQDCWRQILCVGVSLGIVHAQDPVHVRVACVFTRQGLQGCIVFNEPGQPWAPFSWQLRLRLGSRWTVVTTFGPVGFCMVGKGLSLQGSQFWTPPTVPRESCVR